MNRSVEYRGWTIEMVNRTDLRDERIHGQRPFHWWLDARKAGLRKMFRQVIGPGSFEAFLCEIDEHEDAPKQCPAHLGSQCFFVRGKYGRWPEGQLEEVDLCIWCGRIKE